MDKQKASMNVNSWSNEISAMKQQALETERDKYQSLARYYHDLLQNLYSSLKNGADVSLSWGFGEQIVIQKATQETEVKDG